MHQFLTERSSAVLVDLARYGVVSFPRGAPPPPGLKASLIRAIVDRPRRTFQAARAWIRRRGVKKWMACLGLRRGVDRFITFHRLAGPPFQGSPTAASGRALLHGWWCVLDLSLYSNAEHQYQRNYPVHEGKGLHIVACVARPPVSPSFKPFIRDKQ